jgi:hypothetical protein
MRRSLATLALAAAVTTPALSAAPAEAIYCGPIVHQFVCSPVCRVTAQLGAYCVA